MAVLRKPALRIEKRSLQISATLNQGGTARLGVIVGRRYDGRSTRRNRFKRCIREGFRAAQANLRGLDVVVRARRPVCEALLENELAQVLAELSCAREASPQAIVNERNEKTPNLIARLALGVIDVYSAALSPLLGARCRFHPTCSSYARKAILEWGVTRGAGLALRRIAKCHPFHSGGYDPVPRANST